MAIRVQSSNKLVGKGGIKVAIHSAAGMGKTMLVATAPNPVVIMTEKTGADSLSEENIRAIYGDAKGITYDIPVIEAYNTEEIEEAIEFCKKSDYTTVFLDSVSEASKLRLKEELPNHKNAMQAYGIMAQDIDDLLRDTRDDDKNWVYLFHSVKMDVYDDDGEPSSTEFAPGFEGQKMNNEFPYLLGDVYCMVADYDETTGDEIRVLRTRQGDSPFFAKNRRGRLDELERPHLGRIFWKLTKKAKKKSTK